MSTFSPADIIVSPGFATFRGSVIFAQGNMTERRVRKSDLKTLGNNGTQIARVSELGWLITIPVHVPFSTLVPWLQHYQHTSWGRVVAPHVLPVSAIDLTSNQLTIAAHGLTTADAVLQGFDEVSPTSAPAVTKRAVVYAKAVDADNVTLHDSGPHATAGSNVQDFTVAQTSGAFWLTHEAPLTVQRRTGVLRTYRNVQVVEFPKLTCAGGELAWTGNLVIQAFPGYGKVPADGDSAFWTETATDYADPAWDASYALTLPASAAWGAAPWDVLDSESGWEVMFKPTLKDLHSGTWPIATRTLTGFEVTVKGKPLGITRPQFEAVFQEAVGGQISRARNFVLTVNGYTITVYGAALITDPDLIYSVTDSAIGEMTWTGLGTATNDNKPAFAIAAV